MCDFYKDLELSDEDINNDVEDSIENWNSSEEQQITDADKFIIAAGWLVNEYNLSDKKIINRVKAAGNVCVQEFNCGIIHNQMDNKEVLVVILFSQIIDNRSLFTYFFECLYKIGIKGCNVSILVDKTTHTFQIQSEGIRKNPPKAFDDLWNFIVMHEIQKEHFTIELDSLVNRFEGKIFKKDNLVIVNINSPRTLDRQEMEKIENIMRRLDVSDISVHSADSFVSLLTPSLEEKFIPIFLKEEMPTFEKRWEGIEVSEEYRIYEPKGTILGYYSKDDVELCDGPHIVLSPKTIEQCSNKATNKISFEVLFAKVLLHEFAHVLMDNEQLNKDLFSKAMEESLANMIALQVFSKYDRSNYDRVRSFIVNDQPTIYQFGTYQFDINADWKKWKESNKNMPTLKTWFDKCFNEGKIRENLGYSLSDYDDVFKANINSNGDQIIKVIYTSPYTSFGPQTPELEFRFDYTTGKYSYIFGKRQLSEDRIQRIIRFLQDASNMKVFFQLDLHEGFHDNQEFLQIEYKGKKNVISQNIFHRIYDHPFNNLYL